MTEEGQARRSIDVLSLVFYLFLFAWIGGLMLVAQTWGFRDKMLPLIVGVPALALIVAQVVFQELGVPIPQLLQPSGDGGLAEKVEADIDSTTSPDETGTHPLVPMAWIIVLSVALYVFGFVVTIPIYVPLFSYYLLRDWKQSLLITVLFIGLLYVLFIVILDVQLYGGIFGIP